MTLASPSHSHTQLNELKHSVIGNTQAKLAVLGDTDLVHQLVELCKAAPGESKEREERRLESVVIVGSLAHAGSKSIPLLLTLPSLLPNLLSSLLAALPPAPSSARPTARGDEREGEWKRAGVVLQAMTNVVLGMSRWVERRSWGEGLPEEEEEHEGEAEQEGVEERWRGDVGMRVGEFMQTSTAEILVGLLPSKLVNNSQGAKPSRTKMDLPPRTVVALLNLLTALGSFSPSNRGVLLSARVCPREEQGGGGGMEVDRPTPKSEEKGELEEDVLERLSIVLSWAKSRKRPFSACRPTGPLKPFPDETEAEIEERKKKWEDAKRGKSKEEETMARKDFKGEKRFVQPLVAKAALECLSVLLVDHPSPRHWPKDGYQNLMNGDKDFGGPLERWVRLGLEDGEEDVRFGGACAFTTLSRLSEGGFNEVPIPIWSTFFTCLQGFWVGLGRADRDEDEGLKEVQIRAVLLLARALKNQPSPQALLFEMGIFRTLGDLLTLGSGDEREWAEQGGRVSLGEEEEGEMEEGERDRDAHARIREGVLLTLATISLTSTQHHQTLLTIPSLVSKTLISLAHPSPGVRAAAAQLVRGLSRSTGVLRETLVDSGVGLTLVDVLRKETSVDVIEASLAAVANLVLQLSPLKEGLMRADVLPIIISCAATGASDTVRLNALWALKNFAYRASNNHKLRLLKAIKAGRLELRPYLQLNVGSKPESRTQPLIELEILLRNILIGADDVVRYALDETFPRSDLLDLFRAASSCPADEHGEMTQVFREGCNLIECLHVAYPPKADDPSSIQATSDLTNVLMDSFDTLEDAKQPSHAIALNLVIQLARAVRKLPFEAWMSVDLDRMTSRLTSLVGSMGPALEHPSGGGQTDVSSVDLRRLLSPEGRKGEAPDDQMKVD